MLPSVTYKLYFSIQYYMPEESYSGYIFTTQSEVYEPVKDIHKFSDNDSSFAEGYTASVRITLFVYTSTLHVYNIILFNNINQVYVQEINRIFTYRLTLNRYAGCKENLLYSLPVPHMSKPEGHFN